MDKIVLLVDDDKLPMKFYLKALEKKEFRVKQCFEPDSALDFAEKKKAEIVAIILDIMMPPGKKYEKIDTQEGLKTGVYLLKDLRILCPDVPIIVLTNVRNPETLKEFEGKDLVKVARKKNYPPFELADLAENMVSRSK